MDRNPSKSSSKKPDRKSIEKNRRNQMKSLYTQLNSLVPHQPSSSSREVCSLPDQIDEATNYIRTLQANIENLKHKKDSLQGIDPRSSSSSSSMIKSPVQVEVHVNGSALEVTLITGLECQFVFNEAIRILHEEQAEVVNASFSVVDRTVFHTIHAQIAESGSSQGAARINERLKKFALDD